MNAKFHVTICLMLLATLAWTTPTLAQAANETKPPAAAPAAQPAGENAPAAEGFEPAGQAAGEQAAPAKTPAEGEAPADGQPQEGDPNQQKQESPLATYFPFIMIGGFLLLWMFMGRSRKKKEAQRKAMLDNLSKGDRVVTIGGIIGTIVEARETEIVVKVDDNTRMKFARWAVRNAGDAVNEDKKKDTQEQQ